MKNQDILNANELKVITKGGYLGGFVSVRTRLAKRLKEMIRDTELICTPRGTDPNRIILKNLQSWELSNQQAIDVLNQEINKQK